MDELVISIEEQKSEYAEYEVISVFFGGGTPSLLKAEKLEKIMCALRRCFFISQDAEITIEVNPGTVDSAKWQSYKKLGINRASIGLQSANNEELELLGRIHTYEDFLECFRDARAAGFQNLNVDLISSLPGQTIESYEETLKKVIALKPEHISAYSLILEEHTPFYEMFFDKNGDEKSCVVNGKTYHLLTEEEDRDIYHLSKEILERAGFNRYEISNYAKPGFECHHNLVYWRRGEYLGLGAGASSLIRNHRFQNENLYPFAHQEIEELTKQDEMSEFMFLGLRTTKGVSSKIFMELFGTELTDVYGNEIKKLEKEGLLETKEIDGEEMWFRLTELGLDLANYAMTYFVNG